MLHILYKKNLKGFDIMRVNKKAVGLVLVSFGCGITAGVIFSGPGFFMGVLIIALGITELCC